MVALTLANTGFESGVITGWTTYSTGVNNLTVPATNPRTGTYAAHIGQVTGSALVTGAYQDVTLPGGYTGETVTFQGYVQVRGSATAFNSRLTIEFYDAGPVIIGTATTNVIDIDDIIGFQTYGLQSVNAVVPSGAVTVRFKFEGERVVSSLPRAIYDDFSADVTEPSGTSLEVTATLLETLYQPPDPAAVTTTLLTVAYQDDSVPIELTSFFLEVLRSTSGVRTPTVMLIPGGWDPEGPPIPATVIDPD